MTFAFLVFCKVFTLFTCGVIFLYIIRHYIFTHARFLKKQRITYEDLRDSHLPSVSIMIPMHNEEGVVRNIFEILTHEDFSDIQVEIIAINDHSSDKTEAIVNEYVKKYPTLITPIHRYNRKNRGKPCGLNEALEIAKGEVCIIFDADYLPPKGIVQNLVTAFLDPETGAVMGRVIPVNGNKNFLTQIINIERSSGYQVDQQARYHLGLLPQYGGTVGGFRTDLIREFGGFDPLILAEDTDLTYKLFTRGWKVVYTNRCECHEEAVETWPIRGKQIQRWARGHNGVMFHQLFSLFKSPYLNTIQKFEGTLLLMVYFVPFLLLVSLPISLTLCLMETPELYHFTYFSLLLMVYYGFGNFAPFFQSTAALILDRDYKKTSLLALSLTSFTFSVYYASKGFIQAFFDVFSKKVPTWAKTERFRGNS